MSALKITDLYCKFNSTIAVNNLSLSLAPGEVYALLGPNGAGKTTTLNLVLGFMVPSSGSIEIDGASVQDDVLAARAKIAYLPETVMLPPALNAVESLRYFALLAGKQLDAKHAVTFLKEAGLEEGAHLRSTDHYSKGMRQKVGLAIALAKNATLMLLDEPTSGLDARAANELSQLVRTASSRGIAVLMATHDLYRVKDVANRLGILRDGKLIIERDVTSLSSADIEKLYLEQLAA